VSGRARVDPDSPRQLIAAVRRLLDESESTAGSALVTIRKEVDEAVRELTARRRQLEEARRKLKGAEATLEGCWRDPRRNCAGPERAVKAAAAAVREQQSRTEVATEVVAELRRQLDRLGSARHRLSSWQRRYGDAARRELAEVALALDAYLTGSPQAAAGGGRPASAPGPGPAGSTAGGPGGGSGGQPKFSSDALSAGWASSVATRAGRAFFPPEETVMRELAARLTPFAGEYTVDAHGASTSVSIGGTQTGARELAELVRADPAWKGRPVRLFSCNTGKGPRPLAAGLARELDVDVTAPTDLVWSNSAGRSWVGSYDWKMVGGTMQRVPGPPDADGWRTFGAGAQEKETGAEQ